MYGAEFFDFSLWWIFPLVMVVLCFFMMRGRRGSMMCGGGPWGAGRDQRRNGDSARRILDIRYARGEIDREEYEEKADALGGEEGR